jgi:hypothetical protein
VNSVQPERGGLLSGYTLGKHQAMLVVLLSHANGQQNGCIIFLPILICNQEVAYDH